MNRSGWVYKVLHNINLQRLIIKHSFTRSHLENWYRKSDYPKRIRKFKNTHRGERCFIIGNGPSLTSSDLDMLVNEVSFSCNRIYRVLDNTKWRPYYYVVDDTGYVTNDYVNIKNVPSIASFIAVEYEKNKVMPYLDSTVNILIKKTKLDNMIPRWNLDIEQYIGSGHSVTFVMAQLAIYMGFKEIYFLGQDCSTLPDNAHFYGDGNMELSDNDLNNFIYAFYAIRDLAEENKVKVYNATRGGKLELFERKDLDELFMADNIRKDAEIVKPYDPSNN